jgi:hypothetical protein
MQCDKGGQTRHASIGDARMAGPEVAAARQRIV